MTFRLASAPRHDDRPNEDFAAVGTDTAVLLDGSGISEEFEKGCAHGVAWFTRRVGALILAASTDRRPLCDAVAEAIRTTAALHSDTCDLTNPNTPSAMLVAVRFTGEELEYLLLGDSLLVLDSGNGSPRALLDERFEQVSRRITHEGATTPQERHHARIPWHNAPGGYWNVSAEPQAAYEAVTGSVPLSELAGFAMLSDGASRLVDVFGLATWREAMDLIRLKGPQALIDAVRTTEAGDPHNLRWPRTKTNDDATALVWDGRV